MKLRYFTQCSLCRIGWKMIPNYWCDPRTYYLVSLWASLIAYRIFSNKRPWHLCIWTLGLGTWTFIRITYFSKYLYVFLYIKLRSGFRWYLFVFLCNYSLFYVILHFSIFLSFLYIAPNKHLLHKFWYCRILC